MRYNHLANSRSNLFVTIRFSGPEGNRTLHSLLAREKRQPLEHASPNTQRKIKDVTKGIEPSNLILEINVKPI